MNEFEIKIRNAYAIAESQVCQSAMIDKLSQEMCESLARAWTQTAVSLKAFLELQKDW